MHIQLTAWINTGENQWELHDGSSLVILKTGKSQKIVRQRSGLYHPEVNIFFDVEHCYTQCHRFLPITMFLLIFIRQSRLRSSTSSPGKISTRHSASFALCNHNFSVNFHQNIMTHKQQIIWLCLIIKAHHMLDNEGLSYSGTCTLYMMRMSVYRCPCILKPPTQPEKRGPKFEVILKCRDI